MAPRPAKLSPDAARWLKEEIAYIAARRPEAARAIAARIRTARQNLADYPKIGPEGWIQGTRRVVVPPYVLTVRVRRGIIEVAAIRHAQQGDAYTPSGLLPEKAPNACVG